MGIMHYHQHEHDISQPVWDAICTDARKLIAASPVPLAFDLNLPDKPPEVSESQIRFNGVGEDGYESLILTRAGSDSFHTKVGFQGPKPYDLVVCAVLAVASERAGMSLRVWSDANERDWHEPVNWASAQLGRPIAIPPRVKRT